MPPPLDIPNDEDDYVPAFPRDRSADIEGAALNPDSLVGSYFRHDHEDDNAYDEGLLVGQVWVGPMAPFVLYLVEFYGRHGAGGFQKVIGLDKMHAENWRFFDTSDWLVGARADAPASVEQER
jgi:hypothetical protein